MNSVRETLIGVLTFLVLTIFAASCSESKSIVNDLPPLSAECRNSVRVAAVIDESTSMSTSGTAPVKANELRRLIDALAECGGALGIGFVREAPESGLERIEFPRPPLLPAAPVRSPDEQDYEFDDRVAAFNQLRVDRGDAVESVLEKKKPEIDGYFRKVDDLLARPAAKGTDLNSALNAAEIFLSEPGIPPHCQKYLVIVSDGLDNRGRPLVAVKTDAAVLWINSTSAEKVLSRYRASRIESFPSAVDFIVQSTKREDMNDANPK